MARSSGSCPAQKPRYAQALHMLCVDVACGSHQCILLRILWQSFTFLGRHVLPLRCTVVQEAAQLKECTYQLIMCIVAVHVCIAGQRVRLGIYAWRRCVGGHPSAQRNARPYPCDAAIAPFVIVTLQLLSWTPGPFLAVHLNLYKTLNALSVVVYMSSRVWK